MRHRLAAILGHWLLALLVAVLTVLPVITVRQASADSVKCESCVPGDQLSASPRTPFSRHGLLMRYTREQIEAENLLLETAPAAHIDQSIAAKSELDTYSEGASRSLLPLLQYTPVQRNQGTCGNCWVWAGTGCLELALQAQLGISNRLSVQYFNSNYNGGSGAWACCGGNAEYFANYYKNTLKKAIPWSNTNASYVDGVRTCSGSTAMPAGSISTSTSYTLSNVTYSRIRTYSSLDGVSQATAIQNIKNVLDQNKGIYFGFSQADTASWDQFFDFWDYQAESDLWSGGFSHLSTWTSGGGGHAVLCVGYDDTPEGTDNDYWIMLNSWGAPTNRTSGLFRVPMYYNYDSYINNYGYSTRWYTVEPTFTGVDSQQKLIGADDALSYNTASLNYLYLERWTAVSSGTVSTIRVKGTAAGAVKVAIYADSGGQPGALLGYQNTSTAISSGWNTVALSQTAAVTSGTAYWLATASGTGCLGFVYPTVSNGRCQPINYNTFTFSSNPTGLTTQTTWYIQAAGWGSATVTPVTAPAVTNGAGASLVTSSTARLNGEVSATGGEPPTVHIYWGDNDGGTTAGSWDHDLSLGTLGTGAFYSDISGLSASTVYYYRCYASNSAGADWADGTASFTTTATAASPTPLKLIGADDALSYSTASVNYLYLERWTAVSSGTVSTIRVKGTASGAVKVAIYADSGGQPGALMGYQNTSTPISSGWNTVALAQTAAVTSGTGYWLATASGTGCLGFVYPTVSNGRFQPINYSSFTFSSNPTGLTTQSTWYIQAAGWGSTTVTPVTPTTAPVVTNGAGASLVTSSTARLNGEVSSTGGESPAVHIYWGDNDGGTTAGSWDHDLNLGTLGTGAFYSDISGLTSATTYYYRCYASNSAGSDWADGTASFTTAAASPATQKLIGADDALSYNTASLNYLYLERWTAASSGTVSTIRVKGTASGAVKVAIYADSGGQPGALLGYQNTSTPISSGWNTVALTQTATVTSGTAYWLATASGTGCLGFVYPTTSNGRCQPINYSSFTFSNNPTGLTTQTTWYIQAAGWGSTTVTPATAPAVTNGAGASLVTSSTARLNGEVSSTGGESPAVHIYWGDNDGGTTAGSWDHDLSLGTLGTGAFYSDISGLSASTVYYYRCYASNSAESDWADGTASFTTAAASPTTQKLIGADDALSYSTASLNYLYLERWTAVSSGTVSTIRVKGTASGAVKVAIYADSGGQPGALLGYQNTSTPISSGWNTVALAQTATVTSGTAYWLATASGTGCLGFVYPTVSNGRCQPINYNTFTFSSNPTGLTTQTTWYIQAAGWGTGG